MSYLTDKNTKYTIAVDSDGVLANFDARVIMNILKAPIDSVHKSKLWAAVQHYNDTVQPFFETLEKHDDADELMDFIKETFEHYYILTACGYTPSDAEDQKRRWYNKTYGESLHVKVVKKSLDKAQFATPTTILIDDREKSIKPWVEAGGIGILHKNSKDTIKQLCEIILR